MVFSFTVTALRKSGAHSYDPVPAPDEETLLGSPDDKETRVTRLPKRTFFDPSFWLSVFAALSVAVTIRNLFVIQLHSQDLHTDYPTTTFSRPYNGLEKLPRNASSPSWPLSSIHYPDFIGGTESGLIHHALSNSSVVRLDSERTIILQHRVRDYGLDHCAIKVEFSPRPKKQHGHTTRAYGSIGESPYFTLWRIFDDSESKAVLSPPTFPRSLSTQKEFLGNITLDQTRPTQSPFFGCSAGSVQTLEIAVACASDPCIMEFRLTKSPHRQGFLVVQSEDPSPT